MELGKPNVILTELSLEGGKAAMLFISQWVKDWIKSKCSIVMIEIGSNDLH
jgi:hypothetical protein